MSIIHQRQPDQFTCTQACLAMLLGEPVEKVCKVFPTPGMTTMELYTALDRCRFVFDTLIFNRFICDGYYIISVPSLNTPGGGHSVLVEYTDKLTIFDPQRGNPDKLYYSNEGKGDGTPLRWWSETVYVNLGGRLPQ